MSCATSLRLGGVAAQYTALALKAAEKRTSFTDFVEELLITERESRRVRAREMFARALPASLRSRPLISTTSTSPPPRHASRSWIAWLGDFPAASGPVPPILSAAKAIPGPARVIRFFRPAFAPEDRGF